MSEERPFFKTESSGSHTSLRLRVPWVYFWLQCICLLNDRGAGLQCMYSGLFLTKVKAPNRISIRTSIVVYPIIHGTTCNTSLLFISRVYTQCARMRRQPAQMSTLATACASALHSASCAVDKSINRRAYASVYVRIRPCAEQRVGPRWPWSAFVIGWNTCAGLRIPGIPALVIWDAIAPIMTSL